jgi:uncharacterized protein YbdZ (MbtH family)
MSWDEQEDTTVYKVVVNHEEQYSIWPVYRDNPLGWKDVGKSGLKQECLDYIEEVWTDMRPLSLRKQMEEAVQRRAASPPTSLVPPQSPDDSEDDDLVKRLSQGRHPVEVSLRPEKTVERLKESLDRGYVHIKFTGTRGGTELGVRLDQQEMDLSQGDFDNQTGTIRLTGNLVLDYVKVQCCADIDLSSLKGEGYLITLEEA